MTTILDGKKTATLVREQIKQQVEGLKSVGQRVPHIGVIQVGDDPASTTYVNNKYKAAKDVGFDSTILRLEDSISEEELISKVKAWNEDPDMDGFIVQLPLPAHIEEQHILEAIDPKKDIDGFHPENQGKLMDGLDGFVSATPLGIVTLLTQYGVPLKGQECVIIGRSQIVGRPLANLLSQKGKDCTVTICHRQTRDIRRHTQQADIIITAVGVPHFLTADMVKEGAVVVDVGINRVEANNERGYILVGDVDYEHVAPKSSFITPVPGGIGPMTIVSLLSNGLKAYTMRNTINAKK